VYLRSARRYHQIEFIRSRTELSTSYCLPFVKEHNMCTQKFLLGRIHRETRTTAYKKQCVWNKDEWMWGNLTFWKTIVKSDVTTTVDDNNNNNNNNNIHREVCYLKVVHRKHNNKLFVDMYLKNKTDTRCESNDTLVELSHCTIHFCIINKRFRNSLYRRIKHTYILLTISMNSFLYVASYKKKKHLSLAFVYFLLKLDEKSEYDVW